MKQEPNDSNSYQIRVQSHLPDSWSEWFGGFEFKTRPNGETVMIGEVVDQTALHTLLQRIRDIGLTLIEVKCLDDFQKKTILAS